MTGPPHDTPTVTPRRADAGVVRLGRRDIDGNARLIRYG